MLKTLLRALGLALMLGAAGANAGTPAVPMKTSLPGDQLEAYVDGLAREAMDTDHIAGAVVAIVRDGRPVLLKGYGLARIAPAQPVDPRRTLFRIGSLTKTFTWIALMQEVERGHIRLNAPVDAYLPERLRTSEKGFSRPIRIVDLMGHAAGYENRDIGHLFERDATKLVPASEFLLRERPARVRPAGLFPTYSNYGTELAAFAASRSAGLPFAKLLEQRITSPLGMRDTTIREPYPARPGLPAPMNGEMAARVSDGFIWKGGRYSKQPFEFINVPAAGSISSTGADMATYMLALLGDGRLGDRAIYSPATARAFRTPIFRRPACSNGWAHGFQTGCVAGYLSYGHGGDTQYFHTQMTLVPDLSLGVFVSTNTAGGGAFAKNLAEQVVARFYPSAPPPTVASWKPDPAIYNGTFLSSRRGYSGFQKLVGYLMGGGSVAVTADGQLVTSTSTTRRWVSAEEPGVFRSLEKEAPIRFDLGPDGRAVRWHAGSGTTIYERVGWFQTAGALLAFLVPTLLIAAGLLYRWPGQGGVSGGAALERWSLRLARGAALAWVASATALLMWIPSVLGGEPAEWPGTALVASSGLALIASMSSGALLLLTILLAVSPSRRAAWTRGRIARQAAIAITFCAAALLLASWGALAPWSD